MPEIVPFAVVIALVTITPGVDLALVTRSTVVGGRAVGWATSLGLVAGVFVWGAAAGIGLAGLVSASASLFSLIKFVGAAYLVVLGVRYLVGALRSGSRVPAASPRSSDVPPGSLRSAFFVGLWTDVLNPKMAVFYASILPQFMDPGAPLFGQALVLATVHAAIGVLWFGSYTALVARARGVLAGIGGRIVDGVAGAALIGLGVRLSLLSR
jgi:threonine/homoserine/homoserine lactone efflux protein